MQMLLHRSLYTRFVWVASFAALLHCCAVGITAQAAPPGWKLVWSDEFDGDSLDTSKWDAIDWTTPFNNELQAYHPSRVRVENGNLVLTADDEDYGKKTYKSGKVESKWTTQYGRFEIRAKLPGTHGTWPAIWLLPDTSKYPWPSQGEIDIMENRGDQPHVTSSAYHYGPSPRERKFKYLPQKTSRLGELANYHDEFHTYAVEWDERKVKFFVDEVNYYTIYDADVGGFLSQQSSPVEVVLNVAVGGDFVEGAPPDESSVWPQEMLVDFVRVYERENQALPKVFANGGFEANEGSLAGWSTFGSKPPEAPNVLVHGEAVSSGRAALKLAGQFDGKENYSGIAQSISVSPRDSLEASLKSFVPEAESIADTENRVEMRFDYYREEGAAFGSPAYLSSKTIVVADGNTDSNQWSRYHLTDTVPAEAVEARLVVVFAQSNDAKGSVYIDDISFQNVKSSPESVSLKDGRVTPRPCSQRYICKRPGCCSNKRTRGLCRGYER